MGNGQGRPADIELTSTTSPGKQDGLVGQHFGPGGLPSNSPASSYRQAASSVFEGRGRSTWREALLSCEAPCILLTSTIPWAHCIPGTPQANALTFSIAGSNIVPKSLQNVAL